MRIKITETFPGWRTGSWATHGKHRTTMAVAHAGPSRKRSSGKIGWHILIQVTPHLFFSIFNVLRSTKRLRSWKNCNVWLKKFTGKGNKSRFDLMKLSNELMRKPDGLIGCTPWTPSIIVYAFLNHLYASCEVKLNGKIRLMRAKWQVIVSSYKQLKFKFVWHQKHN